MAHSQIIAIVVGGFVEEGRNRKAAWIEGWWCDLILMAILEDEYWATKRKIDGA
ncbi:hypothetical protein EWM64_g10159 [Hericium alpestre]|uniref:Uncharacterized protein n=1 Tax=Hericium alpestre TaxID=135208 RepID=A0A4Y9ZIZ1_9AGAM|nr:hypothetical protein EWM64_g10159 [Hericium alpestre]